MHTQKKTIMWDGEGTNSTVEENSGFYLMIQLFN